MMTLNEEILTFINKLQSWMAKAGVELAKLDDEGMISDKVVDKILQDTSDVMDLMDTLYVSDIDLIDEDGNTKVNYLLDSDSDIRKLMNDWNHYLKLDMLPTNQLPLDNYYRLTSESTSGTGFGLPSGGGVNYILGQDSSGNPAWILKPTLFEMDITV